jgi:hypothetical protein
MSHDPLPDESEFAFALELINQIIPKNRGILSGARPVLL